MSEALDHRASMVTLAATIHQALESIEDGSMSDDDCLVIYDNWGRLKQLVSEFNADVEAAMQARLQHGDLHWGDGRRLYLAPNKTTKSIDNKDTVAALLDATGGDVDRLVECLASQPFKPGACKVTLHEGSMGEKYDDLFETVVTSKTKEGKVKKKIQQADENWNKPRRIAAVEGHPQESNEPREVRR